MATSFLVYEKAESPLVRVNVGYTLAQYTSCYRAYQEEMVNKERREWLADRLHQLIGQGPYLIFLSGYEHRDLVRQQLELWVRVKVEDCDDGFCLRFDSSRTVYSIWATLATIFISTASTLGVWKVWLEGKDGRRWPDPDGPQLGPKCERLNPKKELET